MFFCVYVWWWWERGGLAFVVVMVVVLLDEFAYVCVYCEKVETG